MSEKWVSGDGRIRLYHGHMEDVLPTLNRTGIGQVLTDPPYGIGDRMQGGTWGAAEKYADFREWDKAPSPETINALCSFAPQVILWGGNYFTLPPSRCWLVWDKSNAVRTMADVELAWTNFDRPAKRYRGHVGVHEHDHPSEKPVALMEWCLSFFDVRGAVLDPYMGSGPVGVACARHGLEYVGIECHGPYYETAVARIQEEIERFPLFAEEPPPTQGRLL